MTPPSTSAVVGTMWRRILERLFPRLRPALKAPEELAPDYPEFVFVVRGPDGQFPICQLTDGSWWVLTAMDANKLAEQGAAMSRLGMVPTTNLFVFDVLRQVVIKEAPEATGIAVLDSREEYANLIYTR